MIHKVKETQRYGKTYERKLNGYETQREGNATGRKRKWNDKKKIW